MLIYKEYKKKATLVKGQLAKLACAVVFMHDTRKTKKHCYNSHTYESARIIQKEYISKNMAQIQKGKGNSNYGNMWITNPLTKESKIIKKIDPIPEGWVKGRRVNKGLTCAEKKTEKVKENRKNRYQKYVKFIEIRKYQLEHGWSAVQRKFGINWSVQNFAQQMARIRKHIDHILPYCPQYTKNEVLGIISPKQGCHNPEQH